MKEIDLNIDKNIFKGNILDIGFNNYGIIYNAVKNHENIELEYFEERREKKNIQQGIYENCILFFALDNINSTVGKRKLFKDISLYLNKDGVLSIWDIDKGFGKTFIGEINVCISDDYSKKIKVKALNPFKDNSMKTILKLLQEFFTVTYFKTSEDLYYIRCRKRGIKKDESFVSGDKLTIYS